MEENLKDRFDGKIGSVQQLISTINDEVELNSNRFGEFTKMINENIKEAVLKATKHVRSEVLKKVSAESSMLDHRAIKEVLMSKVDRRDLERLNEIKSNKVETENLVDGIQT